MDNVKFIFRKPQTFTAIKVAGEVYPVDRASNSILIPLDQAQRLVANNMGKIVEEKAAAPVASGETAKDTGNELLKGLLKKTVPELQSIATEAELPEEEWKELTKPNLVNYLIEKAFNTPE